MICPTCTRQCELKDEKEMDGVKLLHVRCPNCGRVFTALEKVPESLSRGGHHLPYYPERDARIVKALERGEPLKIISARHGVTFQRIKQVVKQQTRKGKASRTTAKE